MIKHQAGNSRGNYNYNAYTYFNVNWAPHFHSNLELIYIIDGSVTLSVGGSAYSAGAGEYALILPNQIHSITTNDKATFWIAVFSEQFVPFFVGEADASNGISAVFCCDSDTDAFIKSKLIYSDGASVTMKKSCFYAACDSYLKQEPTKQKAIRKSELICDILDYVSAHYKEKLTLSDVGAHFGYEPHYLSRLLNEDYKINFSRLINEHRVNHAIELLKQGEYTMTDVAMQSGFSSVRNFNYAFKQITSVSPSRFAEREK